MPFQAGDLIRWAHHSDNEGRVCRVKAATETHFTLVDDPYVDHQYPNALARSATIQEADRRGILGETVFSTSDGALVHRDRSVIGR